MTTVGTDPLGVQFDAADLWTLVDAAHAVGLPVLAHAHSLAGIRHALAAGVDGIEHFTGLTETGIRVPDEVLEAVAEAGVFVNPTLGFDREVLASMPAPPHGIAGRHEADRPRLRNLGAPLEGGSLTATIQRSFCGGTKRRERWCIRRFYIKQSLCDTAIVRKAPLSGAP